jgi:hypothetical protein
MRPEAMFVVLYATALLAAAVGLDRLGRARGIARTADEPGAAWPRREVPGFYTGIALVAAAAATTLLLGELLGREHRPAEAAALVSSAVLAILTIGRLGIKLASARSHAGDR